MRRAGMGQAAGTCALFVCAAFGACSYDFDGLVAPAGTAGAAGTGASGGQGGSSGGENDGGGAAGIAGAGAGNAGTAGRAGTAGNAGTTVDAGKGGNAGTDAGSADAGKGGSAGTADAGKGGDADAASDRGPDVISDVRAEVSFDCAAVSGTVYQGHCYYPSPVVTNWDTAKNTGCAAPSHLAVITTVGEQMVVAAILPSTERWIGLHKDLPPNMESSLHWVTNEALSYKIWDSYETGAPEPNYTGDCVRMRPTNNWGDTACTETYAAVCERE